MKTLRLANNNTTAIADKNALALVEVMFGGSKDVARMAVASQGNADRTGSNFIVLGPLLIVLLIITFGCLFFLYNTWHRNRTKRAQIRRNYDNLIGATISRPQSLDLVPRIIVTPETFTSINEEDSVSKTLASW